MTRPCHRSWEREPYREGRLGEKDTRSFERHLRTCAACRASVAGDDRLSELARDLPPPSGPSELALHRVRARVLRDMATGAFATRRRVGPALAAALLLACGGAAAAWAVARRPPALAGRPMATATENASAQRSEAQVVLGLRPAASADAASSDEAPSAEAAPPAAPPSALVVAPVVASTAPAPAVTATATATATAAPRAASSTAVHVAGEAGVAGVPPLASPAPPGSGGLTADDVADYTAATDLLRRGRNDEAAAAFHTYAQAHPSASQAEDASFLEAVALARAGRGDAAALAAERHLATFPRSFHERDAKVLVARAAARRGDCGGARALVSPWLGGEAGQPADPEAEAALRPCGGP